MSKVPGNSETGISIALSIDADSQMLCTQLHSGEEQLYQNKLYLFEYDVRDKTVACIEYKL